MKGPQPLHVQSAGVALPARGPESLPPVAETGECRPNEAQSAVGRDDLIPPLLHDNAEL